MLDRVLDAALAVRIAHPCRVAHHAIVREHRAIDAIEFRFVDIRGDHALFKVIEYHVLGRTAKIAKRLLVKPSPDLAAGLPHHLPIRAARVAKRHHKKPRLSIPAVARMQGRCALAVVDLGFFSGQELQAVELLGLALAKRPAKALHAVVAQRETALIHQLLVDGHCVATQVHLRFDPLVVRLTGRACVRRHGELRTGGGECLNSRWPGWRNLTRQVRRAGGRGGGI